MHEPTPKVRCRIFEDNSGAVAIANVPKVRPRTKHMSTQWFNFRDRDHVAAGELLVEKINTDDQACDHLTKAINRVLLKRHRLTIQGWDDYHKDDDKYDHSRT